MPLLVVALEVILCLKAEWTLHRDNCGNYMGKMLWIPKIRGNCHYVKATVQVYKYRDGRMTVPHGPCKLAIYQASGEPITLTAKQEMEDDA